MDVNENGIEMENELERELEKVPVEKESRYKDFDARYRGRRDCPHVLDFGSKDRIEIFSF